MNTGTQCVPSTSGLLTTVAYQLGEGNTFLPLLFTIPLPLPFPLPYTHLDTSSHAHSLIHTSIYLPLAGGPVTYALEGSVAYAGLLIQVHCTALHCTALR